MKIVENVKTKNITIFSLSLLISFAFRIIFYVYFIGAQDVLSGFIIWVDLPIIILYMMGIFVLRVEGEKRDMMGWIMIFYTFIYLLFLSCYIILAAVSPPVKESLADKFREIASILNLSAMWYGFNVPIFWSYKMKNHLYGVALSIMIIIGILFLGKMIF